MSALLPAKPTLACFVALKFLPLIAFVAVGAFFVDPEVLSLGQLPAAGDLANAVLLAAFAFFGCERPSFGELRTRRCDQNAHHANWRSTKVHRSTIGRRNGKHRASLEKLFVSTANSASFPATPSAPTADDRTTSACIASSLCHDIATLHHDDDSRCALRSFTFLDGAH